MTKKDYILKILELLKDDWEPAKGLGIVIWELDDEGLLDSMFYIFKKGIQNLQDEVLKKKVQKSFDYVKEIRDDEKKDWLENEKELDELENKLDNLL